MHCPLRCLIDICSTCAHGVCSCHFCVCKILPFYPIGNDQFFVEEVVPSDLINSLTARSFNLLVDESENRPLLNSPDLDPDGNYFNSLTYDSKYCTPHSLSQDLSPLPSSLSVMHINCRSLLPKLSEIKDLLHLLPATILALTETWLEENQSDLVNIPGYQFIQEVPLREGVAWGFLSKKEFHTTHKLIHLLLSFLLRDYLLIAP